MCLKNMVQIIYITWITLNVGTIRLGSMLNTIAIFTSRWRSTFYYIIWGKILIRELTAMSCNERLSMEALCGGNRIAGLHKGHHMLSIVKLIGLCRQQKGVNLTTSRVDAGSDAWPCPADKDKGLLSFVAPDLEYGWSRAYGNFGILQLFSPAAAAAVAIGIGLNPLLLSSGEILPWTGTGVIAGRILPTV